MMFRYHDAAYMVIEYASQGDLHTKIIQCGPFKPYQCQFVVGEIAAALSYLHDMDFSFNDLKPENVLITALGHVKVWINTITIIAGKISNNNNNNNNCCS